MSNEKKERICKFKLDDDKKRSIAGEMLAKKAIGEALGISAEDIVISQGKNNKPYAINCHIEFNISHSENIVVCAINDTPIGIDIEKIKPISPNIAKKFFSSTEQEYIFGNTPPCIADYHTEFNEEQLNRFFECWTAKEAYLKYTGDGLIDNLSSLEYDKAHITHFIKNGYVISIYC